MSDVLRLFETGYSQAKKKELREHQVRALDMIRQSFGMGLRRTVLQMPTGAGKTVTASAMIQGALGKGKSVMFTVPRISLVDQAVSEFEGQGIHHIGVIQASHPGEDYSAPVQVASVDTLARRELPPKPGFVIVDECHFMHKGVIKLMDAWPDVHFVGLSATPWAKGMGRLWQDLQIPITMADLIDKGYLSRFTVFAPDNPDMGGVKKSMGEYQERGSAEVMGETKLVASILETWLERGEARPTIGFGVNRAHAQAMQMEFERAGIATGYCDAFTDRVEMARLERKFRSGEINVVWSVRKLTTGVDWPVSCIIDAAPTASESLHVQKIGRGLRVNPGTETCIILDHAGNTLRLGLVTDIHHEHLDGGDRPPKSIKKPRLPKPCPSCGALLTSRVCAACGHERQTAFAVDVEEGQLVEFSSKDSKAKAKPTKDEKQRFYSMAIWLDRERNKGGKLAKGLYKGRFGVWPHMLKDAPLVPDAAFFAYEKSRRIAYAKRMAKQKGAA